MARADALADPTCGFVRVAAHPAPVPLIREFVARDASGEFRAASEWFNSAVDCPGHEPGPDNATMVKGHVLRILMQRPDSVVAEVTWQRVGYVGNGAEAVAPGVDVDTLIAIRTQFGWRIAGPALDPHMPVPPVP